MKVIKILIVLLFSFSCSSKENKKVGLDKKTVNKQSGISDNDLIYNENNFKDGFKRYKFLNEEFQSGKKTVLINSVFYTAAILPKEFYLKRNLKIKDSIDIYKEKLKKEQVVQFDFQLLNQKDILKEKSKGYNYEEYIKYLSFKIKQDFMVVTKNGDTIKPSGVLFERTFGLTPRKRILLYFTFLKKTDKFKLIYHDQLFENGLMKFNLKIK